MGPTAWGEGCVIYHGSETGKPRKVELEAGTGLRPFSSLTGASREVCPPHLLRGTSPETWPMRMGNRHRPELLLFSSRLPPTAAALRPTAP